MILARCLFTGSIYPQNVGPVIYISSCVSNIYFRNNIREQLEVPSIKFKYVWCDHYEGKGGWSVKLTINLLF